MRLLSIALSAAVIVACADRPVSDRRAPAEPEWHWDETVHAPDTVFLSEMTAGEIGAAQRDGATNIIVPIGGLEQNGPFVVTGKHNMVVRLMAEQIARKRGRTLVAETVPFVPQGDLAPPTGHLRYPGTIGVSQSTYVALLEDIVRSMKMTGFENVFLIGDSGGNQTGMQAVAETHDGVFAIFDYYTDDPLDHNHLKSMQIVETPSPIHTSFRHEAILAWIDPGLIRFDDRAPAQRMVNGVRTDDLEALQAVGAALIDYRVTITSRAMDAALAAKPTDAAD